jgi:hypothetical protein
VVKLKLESFTELKHVSWRHILMRPSPVTCLVWALLSCAFTACGPTVKSSLAGSATLPTSVAVLPQNYDEEDIPRERVDLVYAAIKSELRNNRFVVVDNKLIQRVCSTPQCPERTQLVEKYGVDGFVTLKLDSFSKNNFLAGYYNALTGLLTFSDIAGKELVTVKHTESERGGVLFDSGQVFQGVIDQVSHSGDEVYGKLAARFAKTIVDTLPGASKAGSPETTDVALNVTQVRPLPPAAFEVCAEGTPASFAFLLTNGNRASLREVMPGKYCGAFSSLLNFRAPDSPEVELRTAFGTSVRRTVDFPTLPACSLDNRVQVVSEDSTQIVKVLCALVGREKPHPLDGCADTVPACTAEKFVVYRAPTAQGPYTKLTEVKSSSAPIPKTPGELQLVAISPAGAPSTPYQISSVK